VQLMLSRASPSRLLASVTTPSRPSSGNRTAVGSLEERRMAPPLPSSAHRLGLEFRVGVMLPVLTGHAASTSSFHARSRTPTLCRLAGIQKLRNISTRSRRSSGGLDARSRSRRPPSRRRARYGGHTVRRRWRNVSRGIRNGLLCRAWAGECSCSGRPSVQDVLYSGALMSCSRLEAFRALP